MNVNNQYAVHSNDILHTSRYTCQIVICEHFSHPCVVAPTLAPQGRNLSLRTAGHPQAANRNINIVYKAKASHWQRMPDSKQSASFNTNAGTTVDILQGVYNTLYLSLCTYDFSGESQYSHAKCIWTNSFLASKCPGEVKSIGYPTRMYTV